MFVDISKSAPLVVGDVACIRLVSNEEIIGRVTAIADNGSSITITKPIRLQMAMNQKTGDIGMQFMPFMIGVDEDSKFQFRREHTSLTPMRARKDVADQYLHATSSLDLPPKSNIII